MTSSHFGSADGGMIFAFPGQGAQYPGMAEYLLKNFSRAREVFCEAEAVLEIPLRKYCTEYPSQALASFGISQPAIIATSIAAHRVFTDLWGDVRCDLLLGYSLGTLSACIVASSVTFADALMLAAKRATHLAHVFDGSVEYGIMSVVCDSTARLEDLIARVSERTGAVIEIAGFNAPQSFLLAGHRSALNMLRERSDREDVAAGILEGVNIPLHSSLLQGIEHQFSQAFGEVVISDPLIPLYGAATNQWLRTADGIKEELSHQLSLPIHWSHAVDMAARSGNKMNFIEFGPNRILSLFTRLQTKKFNCLSFGNTEAETAKMTRMIRDRQLKMN